MDSVSFGEQLIVFVLRSMLPAGFGQGLSFPILTMKSRNVFYFSNIAVSRINLMIGLSILFFDMYQDVFSGEKIQMGHNTSIISEYQYHFPIRMGKENRRGNALERGAVKRMATGKMMTATSR